MKKILVTGGAGYIGSVLVRKLLERGYQVRILDKLYFGKGPIEELLKNKNLELIVGDITKLNSFPNLMDGVEAVIHLAAFSNDPSADLDPKDTLDVNYEATKKLAEMSKEKKVNRFIYASSCSVYGIGVNEKLTEESIKKPVSLYAETKLMSENALLSMMDENFSPCFLRKATIFGLSQRMRFDLVINALTKSAVIKKKINVFGGGKQWRPLLHVEDAADAYITILEAPIEKIKGQAFNVGSDELNYQMEPLARCVEKCLPGTDVDIVLDDPDKRSYNVSFNKIVNALNFKTKKTVEFGIKEIADAITTQKIKNPDDSIYYNLQFLKQLMIREKAMPFLPFALPLISKDEEDEVLDTLRSGWITTGPKTKLFEEMVRDYIGCKYTIALNSCTGALHLSLVALGIGQGDEVITTPITFAATSNTILNVGAKPVFVDVDKNTLNIDVNKIEEKITKRTKAIIPVDMAGHPCNLDKIIRIAKKYNLEIIEDSAHAIGAEYNGKKIGNIDGVKTTCFSFYPIKNMTTIEGGLVATDDKGIAEKIKILSLHGISKDAWKRYSNQGSIHWQILMPGFKYNMTDIQSSLGIHQIKKLDDFISIRERYTEMYNDAFKDIKEISILNKAENVKHARHLYIIMLNLERVKIDRDKFVFLMKEKGIGTGIHFISIHLQPYYKETFGFKDEDYPNAKFISDRIISLPLYPKMTYYDVNNVIKAVKEIINENKL